MMKIFRLNRILLFSFIVFLFAACVNNDKKEIEIIPGDGDDKELTVENIEEGDWEIAYFTHRVKTAQVDIPARGYALDGFTIKFYGGENYMEYNTIGDETIIKGNYKLGTDGKTITLKYEYKDVETGELVASQKTINVSKLTDKAMIYTHEIALDNGGYIIDEYFLRHKDKGKDQFTDVGEKRALIDPKVLAGSWIVDTIWASNTSSTSSGWNWDTAAMDSLNLKNQGSKFVYNINAEPYSYEQFSVRGTSMQKGIFTINDDVLHYYYDTELEDGRIIDVMSSMAVDMASDGKSFIYTAKEYSYSTNQTKIRRIQTQFIRE